MAPSTPPPPPLSVQRHEADTIKKNRFFHAIDNRSSVVTIQAVCEQENVSHGTDKRWLHQRKNMSDAALRRTGKMRSGRRSKVNFELMNRMLDPQQNPVRDQPWSVQVEHFQLDVGVRTLRKAFNNRSLRASRFKKIRVRTLSEKNKKLRMQYGHDHQHHTVRNFWR